jgi:heme exporter protein D
LLLGGDAMVWNSVGEFFHMGGYGLYVWGSVVVTFGFMLTEVLILRMRRQAILDHLGQARELDADDADEDQGGRS